METQEGLLRNVLGLFPAAQHSHQQAKDPLLVSTHQQLERPAVARLPTGNQLAVGIV